jgi:hypothetical protein
MERDTPKGVGFMRTKVYGTFMFAEGKGLWKQLSRFVTIDSEGTTTGFFFPAGWESTTFCECCAGRTVKFIKIVDTMLT